MVGTAEIGGDSCPC